MRVLFLNFEFPPIGGGGANATGYLFREFSKQSNLHVDCVTSTMGPGDEKVHFSERITLYRLDVDKKDLHFWTQREVLTWLFRAHRQVGRLMSKHQYDLCHAFFGFPAGLEALLRHQNLPYVVSLRGTDVPGFNPRFGPQYILLKPLFRRIWGKAETVVTNSLGLKDLACQFMPELPIGVIPNGIDIEQFSPDSNKKKTPQNLLCVSRLVERKGVQDLLEALPVLLKKFSSVQLKIIGDGDLFAQLVHRSEELGVGHAVELVGYVEHGKLSEYYRWADIFVQPSFHEGMSNTVLEAMASGLPILTSAEGGREELFDENAVIVPYANSEALAEGAISLLEEPTKLSSMGSRSREIAERFSWGNCAKGYLDIYNKLSNLSG